VVKRGGLRGVSDDRKFSGFLNFIFQFFPQGRQEPPMPGGFFGLRKRLGALAFG
jgi:hypothetical protein